MTVANVLYFASVLVFAAFSAPASGAPPTFPEPRVHEARQTLTPIDIDGNIYKPVWEDVPWSADFVDIQGPDAPAGTGPTDATSTRMKMRWDDDYLYIAAEMQAHGWPLIAEFTKHNEPIYQKDSDFEVFIDADGSHHNYKEFEVNANNAVWNLLLDKPYSVGGSEHSGREHHKGDAAYWDAEQVRSRTAVMGGPLGEANSNGRWTVEIAFRHSDTISKTAGKTPAIGRFWRINFSRVEKKGERNWVWSPQMLWDPEQRRYAGAVNMHAPEAWGYVHFAPPPEVVPIVESWKDPLQPLKLAAAQFFRAEQKARQLSQLTNASPFHLQSLQEMRFVDAGTFSGLDVDVSSASASDSSRWTATIRPRKASRCEVTIRWDEFLTWGDACEDAAYMEKVFGKNHAAQTSNLRRDILIFFFLLVCGASGYVFRQNTDYCCVRRAYAFMNKDKVEQRPLLTGVTEGVATSSC